MSAVKILVTTDGSNLSDKAVDTAIGLAEQVGGSVVGMTAVLTPALASRMRILSSRSVLKPFPARLPKRRFPAR